MLFGRLLRMTGIASAVAVAFVAPVLATVTAAPASADMTVDGCTIVSNPTSTHFTSCPNTNFAGVAFSGLNLSYADLAGSSFVACQAAESPQAPTCASSNLIGTNLSNANLTGDLFATCAVSQPEPVVGCAAANLTSADLTNSNLTGAEFGNEGDIVPDNSVGATLTGAIFTGTVLVPPNHTVTATSPAGATVSWSIPTAISGATPGTCTPGSGSTFPLFGTTVTCQVLDIAGDVATGTFQVSVTPTTQYFSRTLYPSDGATLSGRAVALDAEAGYGPGVTKVQFELTGGTLHQAVIATGAPTIYGWLATWDTTTVPNGAYTLQSVATDAGGGSSTSLAITINVHNSLPSTAVVIPANNATVSGTAQAFDATASSGVTRVQYEITGGTLNDSVIATATPTIYGWLAKWNTTTVANGTYTLQSVASSSGGVSGTSAPVTINVSNASPSTTVIIPASGATLDSAKGGVIDAVASPGVAKVSIVATADGATQTLSAIPTIYGWIAVLPATQPCAQCSPISVSGSIQSVASYPGGVSGTSPAVSVTIIVYVEIVVP